VYYLIKFLINKRYLIIIFICNLVKSGKIIFKLKLNITLLKTDTGKWVEYTKIIEIIVFKELGKLAL